MREGKQRYGALKRLGIVASVVAGALVLADAATPQTPSPSAESGVTTRSKSKPDPAAEALELSLDQALWAAIAFDDPAQLGSVLKRGADPNKPEKLSQMTALMTVENAVLAKVLLAGGARPDLRDLTGRTALHHAVRMRDGPEIVRLLVGAGAKVDEPVEDMSNCTPLLLAVEYFIEERDRRTITEVIRTLVELGADINAADSGNRNALAIAAAQNQVDLVRLLLELGADPKYRLDNGRTPLDFALDAKAQDAVRAMAATHSKSPTPN